MNLKFYLLSFLCTITLSGIFSQTFPYTVTVLDEPYTDLTGTTVLTTAPWDDPNFTIPIGFDFVLFGDVTNTLYLAGVGGILSITEDIYSEPTHLIVAYASDLIDRGYNTGEHLSPISYKTEGTPGSQIFKLEWKNAGFWAESDINDSYTNYINLQMWLYEGTNDIEIRFGPNFIDLDADVHDLGGTSVIGFIEGYDYSSYGWDYFWHLTGPTSSPKVTFSDDPYDYYSIQGFNEDPADGMGYRFSTGITSTKEQLSLEDYFSIYPTVANDLLFIESSNQILDASASIYNNLGQLMHTEVLNSVRQTINISNLPIGTYFVTIHSADRILTKKIIKQ